MVSQSARARYAPTVLRIGLAALFLWFGFSQFFDPGSWMSWVPAWAPAFSGMSVYNIVIFNGAFEIIAGAALAFGALTRWIALLLALHMLIITVEIGMTPIGVRDFAITMSTLALALFGSDDLTADRVLCARRSEETV